ncbi:DNA polymerase III subunit delta' [Methylocapsa aurea]|uniref:DNA polymerase III subunit delta' n=1 Tax=Methylocapsa aurea TaxID=663610 RepID=UPI000565A434|nr:DNA polymerase III subunit delta' [Methylocapsa aurea]
MALRPSASGPLDAIPEADRFDTTPHPREATRLFGHAEAEKDLLDSYRAGHLPHAFIIGGPPGIGKATFAWRLARFLLVNPDPASAACAEAVDLFVPGDHTIAHQIGSLAHPDLFLLRRSWNEKTKKLFTDIRVEDVREVIHKFHQAAGRAGYRICILDSAEDLNASSANALLKLIEEPPPRSVFLIVAHKPGQVLATIRSRCRKVALKPLGPADIALIAAALGPPWSLAPEGALTAAIARAHGSMHEVLRLLNGPGVELDAQLSQMLDDLPEIDWRKVHALADRVSLRDNGDDYAALLVSVFDWLHACVRRQAEAGEARALAPYAQVWEKVSEAAREADTFNLDKRPLVLSIFADLAAAARAFSS